MDGVLLSRRGSATPPSSALPGIPDRVARDGADGPDTHSPNGLFPGLRTPLTCGFTEGVTRVSRNPPIRLHRLVAGAYGYHYI
jgi:hypothetical protein